MTTPPSKPQFVVGLDPSLTSFAGIRLRVGASDDIKELTIKTKPAQYPGRLSRIRAITAEVGAFCMGAALVAIEGYAFGARNGREAAGELGGAVRLALHAAGIPMIEVPPSTLKKYVTGKGVADKNIMLREVFRRWAYEAKNDDLADAYSLARFAAHHTVDEQQKTKAWQALAAKVVLLA